MKLYRFDIRTTHMINAHNSERAAVSPLLNLTGDASVNAIYLGAGGKLGMHPAEKNQLFLVVSGRGWVRTAEDDEYRRVIAGHAVYWQAGEKHETMTHNGLTAIVIEGENVDPDKYMERAPLDDNNTRIW